MESAALEPRGQSFTAPPLVVDADLLIRNVGYAVRRGYDQSLITHARHGYSPFAGIPLYASASVAAEVERHLGEIAKRCKKPFEEVLDTWNTVFRPRILFVPLNGKEIDDPRIDAVRALHAPDVPTATLAVMLAESVLVTHNAKHFRPLGIAGQDVTKISIEAHALGVTLKQANAATVLPRLLGYGAYEGAKRAASAFGPELCLALGLLAIGAIIRYWETDTLRRVRTGATQVMREIGPPIASALERGEEAAATLWRFTVTPPEPRPALAFVARELATRSTLTTQEIADSLRWHGYRFKNERAHRTWTRAWLIGNSCFYEVRRGQWSLGYVLSD
jgi:hypothetical protein